MNLMRVDLDPGEWARAREDEGWDVLSVADHLFTDTRPFPHVWVAATAAAIATTRPKITTAFVNNLFRNPVEVAHAALALQQVAAGRFELGLGAGWLRSEMEARGEPYPEPKVRAARFIEAVQIVRQILDTGGCRFAGAHYDIDVAQLGPRPDPPPLLVASVGGHRTAREVTPLLDRVEIKASSASTRNGFLDFAAMAQIPESHLLDMIRRVRDVRPDIEMGMFVLCNAVDDERTRGVRLVLGEDSLYARFFGPPEQVAEGILGLEEMGIGRAQLSPFDDRSLELLAPLLLP